MDDDGWFFFVGCRVVVIIITIYLVKYLLCVFLVYAPRIAIIIEKRTNKRNFFRSFDYSLYSDMIDRVFLKIVFLNNSYRDKIDVFSLPVFSSILDAIDLVDQDHVRYECGNKFPQHLRCTYNEYEHQLQYELFEFVFTNNTATTAAAATTTTGPGIRRSNRKRKCVSIASSAATTTTSNPNNTPSRTSPIIVDGGREAFKKEMAWCVVKNWRRLCQGGFGDARLAMVNSFNNTTTVALSQYDIAQTEDTFESLINDFQGTNGVVGYMKMFSSSSKSMYLNSINYRNTVNLSKHIIMYFDVSRYQELNSEQIFKIPLPVQIDNLYSILSSPSSSESTKVDQDASTSKNASDSDSGNGTTTTTTTNKDNDDDDDDNQEFEPLTVFGSLSTDAERLGYIECLMSSESFSDLYCRELCY